MVRTELYLYKERDGKLPVVLWLDTLPGKVQIKCAERIARWAEVGHELRRPEADYLRDGIYELRASYQGVHYRILYFFSGKAVVVLSHGLTKEREVPESEINRAIERKKQVEADFGQYTFKSEEDRAGGRGNARQERKGPPI